MLGPLAVSRLTRPGLHFVGGVTGLYLQVLPKGGRTWILRATIGSRRREMGLGGYPDVTLAMAREAGRAARDEIRRGIDPIESRRAARKRLAAPAVAMSFREAASAYISAHQAGWKNPKHRDQWNTTLAKYAHPVIGDLDVAAVELKHVMAILEPIWTTKTETATRVRGRIELILDWAAARGFRSGDNPARWKGRLDKLLAKPSKVRRVAHFAALPIDDMPSFMRALRASEGTGARALEFAILTAARSGEVRGANWAEIDLEMGVWTVPAHRMKAGRVHRVPLSEAAIRLLPDRPGRAEDLLFPGPTQRPLSDMTLSAVLRRLSAPAVPHGFRSTFRDWASERTQYPAEVAEMALAHTIANKAEAAYRRGDLFERRRALMDDWALHCEGMSAR